MFSTLVPPRALRLSSTSIKRNLNTPICHRGLLTLAIETSCDDTSIAIVEKTDKSSTKTGNKAKIHFLENITADSRAHRGIHPILALESHQESLANLVNKALKSLPPPKAETEEDGHIKGEGEPATINLADGGIRRKPDFISATRGPGMRSNLSVGLDTGKALSVAWQIPFIGVHHMQAHLLTPRLVSSLSGVGEKGKKQDTASGSGSTTNTTTSTEKPSFPFLSILVSGGHSMLVHSKSLVNHKIMASSEDIAIGEALDKSAREILPLELLQSAKNTMYGKTLEDFVFPNGVVDFAGYQPPRTRGEEVIKRQSSYGWSVTTPFANTRSLQLSFSSIASMVTKIVKARGENLSTDERVELGREAMRVCFEHLASRTIIALESLRRTSSGAAGGSEEEIKTLVVSGGVAANKFLMTVLRSFLDCRGFEDIEIVAPPPYLCTDNAAMIGWAGIEMFEAGWRTDLSCRALRKWTLDPEAEDGGVLGPVGWVKSDSVL